MSSKKDARKNVMIKWDDLIDREKIEKNIQERLVRSLAWKKANTIAITISKGLEWDTQPLIKKGWEQGKVIVLPICNKETKEMNFYEYHPGDPLENRWADIWEPIVDTTKYVSAKELDLIVVPGLLFNHTGHRVGYGGGFYDRYLRRYKGTTISLAADFQFNQDITIEKHDQPVDVIVTNFGTLYCASDT